MILVELQQPVLAQVPERSAYLAGRGERWSFEMSWIDHINAAIVRRIARKDFVLADEQGIEQSGHRYAYSELERAVAYRQPSHIGDDLAVALDFGESRIVVVTENDDAWTTVLAAVDKHPRNRLRSTEWSLALVAAAAAERLALLE